MANVFDMASKDCDKECNFHLGAGASTCMGWSPSYDRRGNMTSTDPNTHTQRLSCSTCRREWSIVTKSGETTVTELLKSEAK